MSIDYDAIKARVAAATEGPWFYRPLVLGAPSTTVMSGDGQVGYFSVGQAIPTDATFIANARQDIPDLLAVIDAVRELHAPDLVYPHLCSECSDFGSDDVPAGRLVRHPCPTIRASEGGTS